ncbi:MAG: bacillithiol system redox-active protein YtxJ [Sediminicola sp.]|tara:strand:+ start:64195 stop:64590 length:396 start_codon:yes stop_codon:yes gene_type:complete
MGFLKGIFGKTNSEDKGDIAPLKWIDLEKMEQLDLLEEQSHYKTQLIFKHSTTCGISRMVLGMFKEDYNFKNGEMELYYLDLHRFRDISNEVAQKFNVRHQSPQLLIIKNGAVVAHASHGAINDLALERYR